MQSSPSFILRERERLATCYYIASTRMAVLMMMMTTRTITTIIISGNTELSGKENAGERKRIKERMRGVLRRARLFLAVFSPPIFWEHKFIQYYKNGHFKLENDGASHKYIVMITVVKAPFISCTIPRLLRPLEFIIRMPVVSSHKTF